MQPCARGAAETLVIQQKGTHALCKKQLDLIRSRFARKALGVLQHFAKHARSAKAASFLMAGKVNSADCSFFLAHRDFEG